MLFQKTFGEGKAIGDTEIAQRALLLLACHANESQEVWWNKAGLEGCFPGIIKVGKDQ